MGRILKLSHQPWTVGKRIGDPSGFGRVFEAVASDGTLGVVKLVPKEPGAQRELLFEDLTGVPNVIPIVDTGETRKEWVLAMPRAQRSLRAELQASGGSISVDAAVPILMDVARALAAIDGRVVHRDIKPDNVLLLEEHWCLADFGVAKYAEASTAADTRKDVFTAAYAAPERWNAERATSATDVYSFGVMGYELVEGIRPFSGPDREDFRRQHVTVEAPQLVKAPPTLAGLLTECMFKPPGSRPTAANVLQRLERIQQPASPAAGRLQTANQSVQAEKAAEFARESAARTEAERRRALFEVAQRSLEPIAGRLRQSVVDNAPAAAAIAGTRFDDWATQLGIATIGMDPVKPADSESWSDWQPKFDLVAYAAVGVTIPPDAHGYAGRAHSLYYCDAQEEGVYRWFETAFMVSPLMSQRTVMNPVALPPGEYAGKALGPGIAEWQVAWPFMAIDQSDELDFVDRWLDWFGAAAQGQLTHPSSMPERPADGTWRR